MVRGLSGDLEAVFLGLHDMRTGVMQMQLAWKLSLRDGTAFENLAHFTPFALAKFDPVAEGLDPLTMDLTPLPIAPRSKPGEAFRPTSTLRSVRESARVPAVLP